jgi:serine/threonine protein kinase
MASVGDKETSEKDSAYASDAWSVGVVMYQLMTFAHPFPRQSYSIAVQNSVDGKFENIPNTRYSAWLRDVVERMIGGVCGFLFLFDSVYSTEGERSPLIGRRAENGRG